MRTSGVCNLLIMLVTLLLAFGCDSNVTDKVYEEVKAEAGFIEIERINFSFRNEGPNLDYTSSKAMIFYSFHPAESDTLKKPLFVFLNGGPGAATTDGLMSFDTAPFSSDPEQGNNEPVFKNPYSWAKLGNLLYIDAPLTGYSYNFYPPGVTNPEFEFDAHNCNPFIDAAQVLRTLLRFLAAHPMIQANEVILVGESYGGTRTTTMLNMMLYYERYGVDNGVQAYIDPTLTAEIQNHLNAVFPLNAGASFLPDEIAVQFKRHIMIEPQLTGRYQTELTGDDFEAPNSVIYQIADQTHTTYKPCNGAAGCTPQDNALRFVTKTALRDMYKYDEIFPWSWILGLKADWQLEHADRASKLLQYKIWTIQPFYAKNRVGAYCYGFKQMETGSFESWAEYDLISPQLRTPLVLFLENKDEMLADVEEDAGLTSPGEGTFPHVLLVDVFGVLPAYDTYFKSVMNFSVLAGFYKNQATDAGYNINPESPRYGELFLQNLPFVEVMITDAPYDLSVYSQVIPYSFEKYAGIVQNVTIHRLCPECDSSFTIHYVPGSLPGVATPATRTIFFPRYREAGHMVAISMPDKLLKDVELWVR